MVHSPAFNNYAILWFDCIRYCRCDGAWISCVEVSVKNTYKRSNMYDKQIEIWQSDRSFRTHWKEQLCSFRSAGNVDFKTWFKTVNMNNTNSKTKLITHSIPLTEYIRLWAIRQQYLWISVRIGDIGPGPYMRREAQTTQSKFRKQIIKYSVSEIEFIL